MEGAIREDGRTEDAGEGREGLSSGFAYASSHLYHQHHNKLLRSDGLPFRVASRCPAAADASAASDGRAGPPRSPHTLASPPNSCVGGGGGPGGAAVFGHGGISNPDSYGTPGSQRPLGAPFNSSGLAGDATLQLRSPFTAGQWQELHRQAFIFKYIMASTPVPPDLLFTSPRPFPDGHPLFSNLGRGGDYLNLHFTGANGDLEPGRCRRTDGKKWRCSRDVAPGQKYCERHVHRARPRSRKPVELDRKEGPASVANAAEGASITSAGINHATQTTTARRSSAARTQSSPAVLTSGPDLKFPFQFMVPRDKKLREGHAEAEAATQQWRLLHSNMGLQQQQYEDDQLNPSCNSLNDHDGCPFPGADISSLENVPDPHDRRDTTRRFIDAWSRPENPFSGVTIGDHHKTNSGQGVSSVRSFGNLSPSNLTLSMSRTCGGGKDHDHFQMGICAADSGKMLAPSWMSPVSPIGSPLAEVLQTSNTVSFWNERTGRESDAARGSAGLIDLMGKTSCDREGTSARRGFSPTRVLQKALVSLSDSSSNNSNSSPTLGAGPRPELGLQWASPSN